MYIIGWLDFVSAVQVSKSQICEDKEIAADLVDRIAQRHRIGPKGDVTREFRKWIANEDDWSQDQTWAYKETDGDEDEGIRVIQGIWVTFVVLEGRAEDT